MSGQPHDLSLSEATKRIESVVTVTLEAKGHDTLLTLRHMGVPDDELGRSHEGGWQYIVGAIAERFAKPR